MFRRADLTAAGLPRPEIDALCRDAVIVRRGVYVPSGDSKHLYARRCEAALAAVRAGAALAGPSAAFHWDLPLIDVPEAIFLRGLTRGRYAGGVRLIHGDAEYVLHDGALVTTPAWTVIDCARLLSRRDGLIIADAVLHEGLCTVGELRTTLEEAGPLHGISRARWVVANADPLSESPGETWTRMVVRDLGYDVVSQFHVQTDDGGADIDLLIADTLLGLEFDGRLKYRGKHKGQAENRIVREKIRQGKLEELGYHILRVVWDQLHKPAALDRRIRAKGVRPAHRPRPIPY
ncbi:MAG: hypothetical protein U0R23_11175 [Candidatus Nanopelagicales bacterium]